MCIAYIDELLCSSRTGGFAYDNKYHILVEPAGLPFKDDICIFISAEPVDLPSKLIYTLVEPVGLPKLTKYHILVERGVCH